ncbi:hypothetical protein [Aquabacterium sp. J223]|uniref:hypothetical protein n=1 Tax=Aquabacterium sp. J223 TaxID=2898431 RepID=UPI0021AD7198|nr:hypothetical protein [Aquabacterium sp. J223]UUX97047.1 hypothetical protein LRS07_07295 [Aquabacterium sp. J223]
MREDRPSAKGVNDLRTPGTFREGEDLRPNVPDPTATDGLAGTRDAGRRADAHRDPITGAPGSHPVGTGVGALAGGVAAGAAIGTVAGPIGTAVGAAVGALAGGLIGKGVADMIDPAAEDAHWRDHYATQPYVDPTFGYEDYGPAYRYGVDRYATDPDRDFESLEADLHRDWGTARAGSRLEWHQAKPAARDAWQRVKNGVERAIPGDRDGDGR